MTEETLKARWRRAYDGQTFEGDLRGYNGYRSARTYALLKASLAAATRGWENLSVLDAGCGTGYTGSFLTARNRVTGLDFSFRMAGYARDVYERVLVGDVERLPFHDHQFDALISTGVWQCLRPDTPFLGEAARVVRPGGDVVFGWVLNGDFLLYRRGVHFRLDPSVTLSLLTAQTIPGLLAAAGLDVVRIHAAFFPLGVAGLRHVPGLARPLIPAFTIQARVRK